MGDYATPDPFKGVDFNLEDGALSTYVPGDNPDRFTSTTLVIPRDRWFCLQVEMTVSPDAGALTILVDGEIGLEQKNMNTRPAAGVHLLRTGVDWSSKQADPKCPFCHEPIPVEPLNRALAPYDAWAAGLRRDEGPSRANTPVVGFEAGRGKVVRDALIRAD